jgi:hypothetical protein
MSKETSLFGKWLVEAKGISLEDYADRPIAAKRALEDEYERQAWQRKSQEAAARAAADTPTDFYAWLSKEHELTRAEFEKLSASRQNGLANEHAFALSKRADLEEKAKGDQLRLPPELKDASPRQQLDWINKQALLKSGHIRE